MVHGYVNQFTLDSGSDSNTHTHTLDYTRHQIFEPPALPIEGKGQICRTLAFLAPEPSLSGKTNDQTLA